MNHTLIWLLWAIGAAVPALIIGNPLYLILLALCVGLVHTAVGSDLRRAAAWRDALKFGMLIWAITIPYHLLTHHQGKQVLLRLPRSWPIIGGSVTLEAVAQGVAVGLALWTLLLVVGTFYLAVDRGAMLRLLPASLFRAAVPVCIVLDLVPRLVLSAQEIREAQRIRGRRSSGWREQLVLLPPILAEGAKATIRNAEAMVLRGMGTQQGERSVHPSRRVGQLTLLGITLALCGIALSAYPQSPPLAAAVLSLLGGLLLCYIALASTRSLPHRPDRQELRHRASRVVAITSFTVLLGVMILHTVSRSSLAYDPFASRTLLPEFNVWVGLLLTPLALPGLMVLYAGDGHRTASTQAEPSSDQR